MSVSNSNLNSKINSKIIAFAFPPNASVKCFIDYKRRHINSPYALIHVIFNCPHKNLNMEREMPLQFMSVARTPC